MPGALEITVDASQLRRVASVLKAAEGGAELRKDLIKDIRVAVQPGTDQVKAKLRSMPASDANPPMGGYLATRVRTSVRLSGPSAGVRVQIGQTPGLRKFKLAARRLNSGSWRHPVFGRGGWASQSSPIPGFFDETLRAGKERYYEAVVLAVRQLAARLGKF